MYSKFFTMLIATIVAIGAYAANPAAADSLDKAPRIQMGEMFFAVPGGKRVAFPPSSRKPESILTVTGAETGMLTLVIENVGEAVHEIRSPLFMAAKEVKVEIIDSNGDMVAESEGTDLLELELAPGYSAILKIKLAGAVKKSFKKDPNLVLDYEISCHAAGHYEAGMRALITLVGASVAS